MEDPPYDKLKEGYLQLLSKNKSLKHNLEKSIKNCDLLKSGIDERDQMIEIRNQSISELIAKQDAFKQQIQSYESKIESLEQKLNQTNINVGENQQNNQESLNEELIQEFNNERRSLHKQIDELKIDISQKSDLIQSITSDNNKYREEITSAHNSITELQNSLNLLKNENEELKNNVMSLKTLKEETQKALQSADNGQSQIVAQIEMINKLKSEISNKAEIHNAEISQLKAQYEKQIQTQNEKIEFITSQLNNSNTNIQNLHESSEKLSQLLKDSQQTISDLNSSMQSLSNENSNLRSQIQELTDNNAKLLQSNNYFRDQISQSNQRAEALKADVSKLMSDKKRIDELLTEKDKDLADLTQKLDTLRSNDKQQSQNYQQRLLELESQKQVHDDEVSSLKIKNDELTKIIQKQADELIPLRSECNALRARQQEMDQEISLRAAAEAERNTIRDEYNNLSTENDKIKEELISLHRVSIELSHAKEELKEAKQKLDSMNEQAKLDAESFEKQNSQLDEIISSLTASDNQKTETIAKLSASLQNLQDRYDDASRNLTLLPSLQEKLKATEDELLKLRAEKEDLDTSLESEIAKSANFKKRVDKLESQKHAADKKIVSLDEEIAALKSKLTAIEKDRGETKSPNNAVFPDYVRKVLLQFFMKDAGDRSAMIPVILKLVGCNDDQITAAQRCYAESNQVISQAFSFFGMRK